MMLGNRTRLGSGKRGISINSYEEFFVLMRLIDGAAALAEKERAEAAAQTLGESSDFACGAHDGILDDFRGLIDPIDHILADAVETRELHIQRFAGIGDHRFHTAELIARRQSDLDEIGRCDAEIFSN